MIYLDYNATTPVLEEVIAGMEPYLHDKWGNAASAYRFGADAAKAVEEARIAVAELLGCLPQEVVFTSGAAEANNAALHGAVFGQLGKRHVVTSQVEHSSVLAYCRYLEQYHGIRVSYLPVNRIGSLDVRELEKAITADTAVVSLMYANNETGVLFPVEELTAECKNRGVCFHTDAVQAVGKLPLKDAASLLDYISISGHKIGAPKGVGALVVRDKAPFVPFINAGKQQGGRRGGTEAVPNIVGLGVAAKLAQKQLSHWTDLQLVKDHFEQQLLARFSDAEIFGSGESRLPNTTNFRIPGLDGDAAVTFLDRAGICVSSGSACMDSSIAPSHVIQAMTGSYDEATECIRVSISPATTHSDLEQLLEQLDLLKDIIG